MVIFPLENPILPIKPFNRVPCLVASANMVDKNAIGGGITFQLINDMSIMKA